MKKGKFIVIDGTDGSGKATQAKLLIKKLQKENRKVRTIDFPQYEKSFFGKLIGECLVGKYGDFLSVDPHIASVLYAADRWQASNKIKKWLKDGFIVVADRYASSNQIHQGSKIKDAKKRKKFLGWLEQLEYEVFKISRPDIIIFLNTPIEITMKLLENASASKKKKYNKNKKDLAENNPKHLFNSQKNALKLVKEQNNWINIECVEKGKLLPREVITEKIWQKMKDYIR